MIDMQQLRKDLLKAIKTPKKTAKTKILVRRTMLPCNHKVVSGINKVITNYFEGANHNRIRNHKSQSISFMPTDTIQVEQQDQSQKDTALVNKLLKDENKRILKPNKTLQDEIVLYLNKVRESEAIAMKSRNKRKLHRGSTQRLAYSPHKSKGEKCNLMDSFIADCEMSIGKYDTDRRVLRHKINNI